MPSVMPLSSEATRSDHANECSKRAVEWEVEQAEDREAEECGPECGLTLGEADGVDEVCGHGADAEFEPELDVVIVDVSCLE